MSTSITWAHFALFMQGLQWTLILTVIGFAGGAIGGLLVALARTAPNTLIRRVAWAFIEVFRGTPLLMQLFVVYSPAGPELGLRELPDFRIIPKG